MIARHGIIERDCYRTAGNSRKPIQAHGGSILAEEGFFCWYGENKEKTHGGSGIWHWDMRCCRSRDLDNWKVCGLLIPPDEKIAQPVGVFAINGSEERMAPFFINSTGQISTLVCLNGEAYEAAQANTPSGSLPNSD